MQHCIVQIYSLQLIMLQLYHKPAENHKSYGQTHSQVSFSRGDLMIKRTIAKNSL